MKTTIKTGLAALVLLLAISCKKESLSIPPSASIKTEDNAAIKTSGHYIGEHYGGGVIFWMTTDSLHGLIAATVDLPGIGPWSLSYTATGASRTGIGRGHTNTQKIVSSIGKGRYAAYGCTMFQRSGYTDWFLPSKDELNELYKQKNLVGGFANSYYWSSSEYSYDYAWLQHFSNGHQVNGGKDYTGGYVRAIRAF